MRGREEPMGGGPRTNHKAKLEGKLDQVGKAIADVARMKRAVDRVKMDEAGRRRKQGPGPEVPDEAGGMVVDGEGRVRKGSRQKGHDTLRVVSRAFVPSPVGRR